MTRVNEMQAALEADYNVPASERASAYHGCEARVYHGSSYTGSRCANRGTVHEDQGNTYGRGERAGQPHGKQWFCKAHSLAGKAAREARADARRDAKVRARDAGIARRERQRAGFAQRIVDCDTLDTAERLVREIYSYARGYS